MEITLETLLKEVEDGLRRGYSIGYIEGYNKGRDSNAIETGTFAYIIEHHLEQIREKYASKS
jgi:hypothetical protein